MRGETCPQCARYEAVYRQARSYAEYRPPFRSLVIRLKYTPDRALGELAAGLVLETAAGLLSPTEHARTLVVPVPLSPKRLNQRGYNQVDPFGRPLAARLGLPYRPDALRRTRETRSQVGLTPDQRVVNLQSAFEADPGAAAGRHVLLLDDVFTSGATGNTCTRALLGAGAESVKVFTLARAVPGKDE
jgi:ComF family protein